MPAQSKLGICGNCNCYIFIITMFEDSRSFQWWDSELEAVCWASVFGSTCLKNRKEKWIRLAFSHSSAQCKAVKTGCTCPWVGQGGRHDTVPGAGAGRAGGGGTLTAEPWVQGSPANKVLKGCPELNPLCQVQKDLPSSESPPGKLQSRLQRLG